MQFIPAEDGRIAAHTTAEDLPQIDPATIKKMPDMLAPFLAEQLGLVHPRADSHPVEETSCNESGDTSASDRQGDVLNELIA